MFGRRRSRREMIVERVKEAPAALLEKILPEPPKPKRLRTMAAGAATGAAAMYFLDPARGRSRRIQARDRAAALARRVTRRMGRVGTKVAADAHGVRQRMAHPTPENPSYNDATLAAKVESELFVGRDVPKDRVSINAENGVVVLRGEVDRPEQIRELERAASKIPGVRGVKTLLHLPNTLAPNKADALQAG